MADYFTRFFLVLLALVTVTRLWLALRQIGHVRRHRARVPEAFADQISQSAHEKAADYAVDRTKAGIFRLLVDTALLLALTLGGGLALLHGFWAERSDGLVYGIALIASLGVLSALVDLPLSLYRQFVIEARHGFNRMTLGLFFADLAKQTVLGAVIGLPVLAAVLWLMAGMGERWWLYVWLFWCGFNLLLLFIYPTWIAPLFNKFEAMADNELKTRIEALLERCGFTSNGLFVMDGSKRSSHGNAYFTGFGRHKRIVFFDTLLARLTPAEIEAVLAHELGHFKHRHVTQRIAMTFAASLGFLWLLGQLGDAEWFYAGLGVPARNDALALVLFFLVVPLLTFFASPLLSGLSRRHEFQADAYAVRQTAADDLATALVKLYQDNASTLTPDPLHSLFYDSHPPAAARIARLASAKEAAA